jgi:gamma-glutamyltranspeptidase
VLKDGGNAVDACVAACAALGVVSAGQCGIGGDLFAVVARPGARPVVLNASGRAGSKATPEFVRAGAPTGRMPAKGPLSTVTPGCVAGWAAALDRFGTRPLTELLQPAVRLADEGFPIGRHLSSGINAAQGIMNDAARAVFTPRASGDVLRQPDLAASLGRIAAEGPRFMYDGELGQAVGRFLEAEGGHHTPADLASYHVVWVAPASVPFRGYEVCGPPPNSQALLHLLSLRMLEPLDLTGPDLPRLQFEALTAAHAYARPQIADPDFHSVPLEQLLSPEKAQAPVRPPEPVAAGDTVYLCAADDQGTVVSMIQSLREGFGSGLMVPGTGIVLSNRGRDFGLADGDPNQIAPGKRPRHTLSPALVLKDGRPVAAYGTRGGDGQPYTMGQLGCNLLALGMTPEAALAAPRWTVDTAGGVAAERSLAPAADVKTLADFDDACGVASVVQFDGVWRGAADPRGEGLALAL